MEQLLEQSERILAAENNSFRRYLYDHIRWANRLTGIVGARGTGKTTLLLQWLKAQKLPAARAAYFSLDDLYFTQNSLKETATEFYKKGGKILVLDEVHKYRNWSAEIKNLYDFYPDLKIIFTGSSIIDMSRQQGDLSRRAVIYELPGFSYREFLAVKKIAHLPVISLKLLLDDPAAARKIIPPKFRPIEHFGAYLESGYYPFALEDPENHARRINQLIRTVIEYDMAELKDFDVRNARKLLQLVYIIAQQVPFKPNISALAEKAGIHRNSLNNYLHFLEKARLISLLYPRGRSVAVLQKPEKIYLHNTSLQYALAEGEVEKGSVRETFFLSQVAPHYKVTMPPAGDFMLNNKFVFEVGGKGKDSKHIRGIKNSRVVRDDLEFPVGNVLPLWMFGLLY
ncbi:MAG TPA: AAA family ATPase [Bacteroidia bacterium]|nr:AAA family ATPase [Bacteroidia bacterium]